MENLNLESLLKKLLWLCAFTLVALFLYASLNVFIADSELWALSSSRYFWSFEGISRALHYKPAFHALLNAIYSLGFAPDIMALFTRYFFGLLAVVQLYLVFQICLRLFGDELSAWLTVFVILSTSYFLFRGFRIRSDYLATTFFLCALWVLTSPRWPDRAWMKVGLVLSTLLMLAATPKSIYLLFLLMACFGALRPQRTGPISKANLRLAAFSFALIALAVLCIPDVRQSYLMSARYFIDSFNHPELPPYFSRESMKYVFHLFQSNILITVLVVLNFYFCFRPPQWSRSLNRLRWVSALTILPMLLHNHRTPFFLVSLLPPLLLFSGRDLRCLLFRGNIRHKLIITAFILLGLTSLRSFEILSDRRTNGDQLKYLRDIRGFLDELHDGGMSVVDVGGVLLHPGASPAYLGASDEVARAGFLNWVQTEKPEWILDSYRLSQFGDSTLIDYIAANYVRLPGGVWHRSQPVKNWARNLVLNIESLLDLSPTFNEKTHLIFQTSGPKDDFTAPRFQVGDIEFAYHTPLPIDLVWGIDRLILSDTPMKAAWAHLPFPSTYPLDSYYLFYFDTRL